MAVVTAAGSFGGGVEKKGLARSWSHEMSPRQFCDGLEHVPLLLTGCQGCMILKFSVFVEYGTGGGTG